MKTPSSNTLIGIYWQGFRSGHYYASLFEASDRSDAEKAFDELKTNGALPDYSPGCSLKPPIETLELGAAATVPATFEGKSIAYLGDTTSAPVGND